MSGTSFSKFYVKSYTATSDDAFRVEDNANIILSSVNIHCYSNDAYYGSSLSTPGIISANSTVWFDAPVRPFDLMFKNKTAGNNCQIVIVGCLKED